MDSIIKKLLVKEGSKLSLSDHDPSFTAYYKKEDSAVVLEGFKKELNELQEKLYASGRYAVLIIFQAMDAAGKDSAIAHVMSGVNPQGCEVYSFKQPSVEESHHDFLWRHHKALPEKSKIGIHNRSHYENVLVCRVHPEIIIKENHSRFKKADDIDTKFWESRYESIRNFEKHLAINGTVIIKFFLNVSKDEQKERFLARIEDPVKNWKFSSMDLQEREHFGEYMKAYEDALSETSVKEAPWYVIPADKKWFSRIAIINVIVDTLKSLDLTPPEMTEEEKKDLETGKRKLMEEG